MVYSLKSSSSNNVRTNATDTQVHLVLTSSGFILAKFIARIFSFHAQQVVMIIIKFYFYKGL
jgi:hypothetical protein